MSDAHMRPPQGGAQDDSFFDLTQRAALATGVALASLRAPAAPAALALMTRLEAAAQEAPASFPDDPRAAPAAQGFCILDLEEAWLAVAILARNPDALGKPHRVKLLAALDEYLARQSFVGGTSACFFIIATPFVGRAAE